MALSESRNYSFPRAPYVSRHLISERLIDSCFFFQNSDLTRFGQTFCDVQSGTDFVSTTRFYHLVENLCQAVPIQPIQPGALLYANAL